MKIKQLFFSLSLSALLLVTAGTVGARDTDIYIVDPTATNSEVRPNLMLILDTSGSMNEEVSTTQTRLEVMKEALLGILDELNNVNVGLMYFTSDSNGPDYGASVAYPIKNVSDVVTNTGNVQAIVFDGVDDAEEVGGTVDIDEDTIYLNRNSSGSSTTVGLRFQHFYVPQGAKITSAKLVVRAGSDNSGTVNISITADKTGNAAPYTAGASSDISNTVGRPQTTNAYSWDGGNGGLPWTNGSFYETGDLKNVIEEVVSEPTWCYGNTLALKLASVSGTGRRQIQAYDRMGNTITRGTSLVITYTPPTVASTCGDTKHMRIGFPVDDAQQRTTGTNFNTGGGTLELGQNNSGQNQYVGLRFRDMQIPPGATIVNATLSFTASAGDTNAVSLTIRGESNSNAAEYSSSNKISDASRPYTTQNVSWSPPNTSTNQVITTPNLASIVQAIIDLSGWTSGNAMAFRVDGTGRRRVYSRDGLAISAPILRVQYTAGSSTAVFTKTVREEIKERLVPIRAIARTPNIPSLYEAALYFRGGAVDYGKTRGNDGAPNARWTAVSHPDSYIPGSGTVSLPVGSTCSAADPNAADCVGETITGTPIYESPIEYSCQTNHMVLLTDGIANGNGAESKIKAMAGLGGTYDCAGSNANQECGLELVDFLFRQDQVTAGTAAPGLQNVRTHTIGLNLDDAFLQDLATRGGGLYKSVSSSSELVTAFSRVLNEVLSSPTSFVSPSLSINAFNRLYNRDEIYFTLFSPKLETSWPGNVKKFTLCANTTALGCTFGDVIDANGNVAIDPATAKILTTSHSYWSSVVDGPTVQLGGAGEQVTPNASRRVYTYTGTSDNPASPVDLTLTAHAVTTSNTALTNTMLGVTAAERDALIHWMRGRDVDDEDGDCATGAAATDACYTENRWPFGDALHSRPVTVTYGGTVAAPVIKLIVGTNDGGIRMVDVASGQEDWFIHFPEFLTTQQLMRANGAGQHLATVDGSPTIRVIDNNNDGIINPGGTAPAGADKVYMYIGMRRGGSDIYAFDITPPGILTAASPVGTVAPKYMWRIKGGTGNFTKLGQTWSRPQLVTVLLKCDNASCDDGVGTTKDSMRKTVLMFGGGYDTNYDDIMPTGADGVGGAIYMVDPDTGARLWWASGTGSGADLELAKMNYSIPSDLALLDSNQDGAVDRIYVGDTRGQLWRLDLNNQIDPTASNANGRNAGSTGYVLADVGCTGGTRANHCSGTAAVNKRGFFYPPDIAQVRDSDYSSVEIYDYITIASGDREDPLDKKTPSATPVNNRIYAFRDTYPDTNLGPPATIPTTPIDESALYDATVDNLADSSSGSYAAALAALRAAKGWYINLNTGGWIGEKSLARTTIFAGVLYVTTFTPPVSSAAAVPCAAPAEGTAKVYGLGLLDATGALNTNGDRAEVVGGGIPSELVVIIREGGSSGLVGTSGGGKVVGVDSELPQTKTYWYQD